MALVITKTYAAGDILLEVDLDHFRDGLLTFFNTDKIAAANFASLALTSTKFSGTELTSSDSTTLTFGSDSDGTIGVNASKELVFNTTTSGCTLTFKAISKTTIMGLTSVGVPGEVVIGSGDSGLGALYLTSKYRKPVLQYTSSTTVTLENNSGTLHQSVVALPKSLIAITENLSTTQKYRRMNIAATANGYASGQSGAALGGLRVGLTLTSNTWYFIYAVKVQFGTDAGNRIIMVGDNVLPNQDNYATLDGRYGEGQWVYLGMLRYGYGVVGSTTSIVPFVYSNKGWCHFTLGDPTVATAGLTLAQSTTNADDTPFHTLADGSSGSTVPIDGMQLGQFMMVRQSTSDWALRDASNVVVWRGGWPDPELGNDETHAHLIVVGLQAGMNFTQARIRNAAVDKRLALTAFVDRYIGNRRHGHGV